MKEAFKHYLEEIGLPPTLRKRVEELYSGCQRLCPEEIKDIIVTDYVQTTEGRQYEGLECFSEHYNVSAYIAAPEEQYNMAAMGGRFFHYSVTKKHYDMKKATQESRFSVQARTVDGTQLSLKASGENCDHLRHILEQHIQTNMVR